MVEHAAGAAHDAPRSRSHVLGLFCACGGLVVLCWLLMTGTAHAAERPERSSGPVAHVVDRAADHELAPRAQTVVHKVRAHVATTRTAAHETTHTTTRVVRNTAAAATETVERHAPRPPAELHELTHKATQALVVHQPVTGSRAHDARGTDRPGSTGGHPRATMPGLADAASAVPAGARAHLDVVRAVLVRTVLPDQTHQPAPRPAGSGGDASGGSAGSGALTEQSERLPGTALATRAAEPRPEHPIEPAYPPGCSPD